MFKLSLKDFEPLQDLEIEEEQILLFIWKLEETVFIARSSNS